jgi:fructose-1,6-bisphosphatase/inositol monophosphatase family enzyme
MPLQQKVISYRTLFAENPHREVIEGMLEAAETGSTISRDWYETAHADGGKDADAILQVEIKYENRAGDGYEDVLTVADRECEEAMIPILKRIRDVPIVGEETGHEVPDGSIPEGGQRWLIDPIDGTFCFKNGYPDFSITLALQTKQGGKWHTDVGLVACPMNSEIYVADQQQAYLVQGERAKTLRAQAPEPPAFSGSLDDAFAGKRIETCIFSKNPEKTAWKGLEKQVGERLGDASQSTFSTANMVAKIADGWVDGAIICADALEYAWDTDAAIHIAEKAGAKVKHTEIDGEPCVFIANSQSLLTALEHVTKQELGKAQTQQRGAAQRA